MPMPTHAPVDTPGYWILRDAFNGSKSFGVFVCENAKCNKQQWISAHANKAFRMSCNNCEKRVLPTYMWVNTHKSDKDKNITSKQKPHDSNRCEACEKGLCIQSVEITVGETLVPPYPLLSESYKGGVRGTAGSLTGGGKGEPLVPPGGDDLEIKRNLLREKIKKSFLDLD